MKLDPRTIMMTALCISILAIMYRDISILFGLLIISVILSSVLGADLCGLIYRFRKFLSLIVMITFIQSIFAPSGKVLISVFDIPVLTVGGIVMGIAIFLRITVLMVSGAGLATCGGRELVQGLIQIKIPYEVAFMVYIGIRFIPLLTEEIKDSLTAIRLRGVDIENIPVSSRIKVYTYLFTPIITGTIVRAQNISIAMEMRGFRAFPKRTSHFELTFGHLDYVLLILCPLLTILFILFWEGLI